MQFGSGCIRRCLFLEIPKNWNTEAVETENVAAILCSLGWFLSTLPRNGHHPSPSPCSNSLTLILKTTAVSIQDFSLQFSYGTRVSSQVFNNDGFITSL